jgi:CspA family cold shock protein
MIVRRGRRVNLDSRIMFGSKNEDDKLSAALEAYKHDYASRIKNPENMDAQKAAALVEEAKAIVGRSGLGPALAPTLLEHIKHWPSWSKRDDFQKWVGFPATDIRATSEENSKKKEVTGVLFTYKGERYGFVQPQDGGKDVFVHISAVERAGLSTLNEGAVIDYDLVANKGKQSAENIKVK